jgi:hypothetical protein
MPALKKPRSAPAAEAPAAGAATPAEVTNATIIRELEDARLLAMTGKQPAAAISAIMSKAKMVGLLSDKPEGVPERGRGFDGNYAEAARRVSLLLRLAENEKSEGNKR